MSSRMERSDHKIKSSFNSRAAIAGILGPGSLSAAIYWINFKIYDLFPIFSGLSHIQLYVILKLPIAAISKG